MTTAPYAPLHLTHAEALNSVRYRAAKAQAEEEGRVLTIGARPAAPAPVHPRGTIYLHKTCSPAEYRDAAARAEAAGVPVVFLED